MDNDSEVFESVWDALADTPAEAESMKARNELASAIIARIREKGLAQSEAAKVCKVTQPRINDLVRGRLNRFSLDALVDMASCLGIRVRIDAA